MKEVLFFYILFLLTTFVDVNAYNNITPGEQWNDTNGVLINAHGGCVIYHEGAYYWFGEDRNGFYCNGISCYKSTDLYNWTKLGLAFTPSGSKTPDGNDAAPGRVLERPKVIYNPSAGKWVMYIHWENGNDYNDAKICVAIADNLQGPYVFYKAARPNGHDSRDQTVLKDSDGKAYHFGASRMNSDILINELTGDYLDVTENEYFSLSGKNLEAPAIFKAGDIYFGIYSHCTGWDPNPGAFAYTFDLFDDWTIGENFAIDSGKETTYRSQSAYVFKIPYYEGAYVYMGDRWVSSNPGSSNVVWLPLSIRTGYPTVKWYDQWDLSVFEDVDRYQRAHEIITGNTYLLLEKSSNRFISQNADYNIHIADDNELINLKFSVIETGKPYVYKIQELDSGNFFESYFGSLRLNPNNNGKNQEWLFLLQEDGYYKIKNINDDRYLSVSGASTLANTSVYLSNDASRAKSFGFYFDIKNFDYEPADIFSTAYRNEMKILVEEQQKYFDSLTSLEKIHPSSGVKAIEVYGINGYLLYKQAVYSENNIPAYLTEKMAKGMYLVKTISQENATVEKIIVK
jgi:hypothetical protein